MSDNSKLKWSSALKVVLKGLNDIPHKITGFTPRYLQFGLTASGRDMPQTPVECARTQATVRSRTAQDVRKAKHALNHKKSDFQLKNLVKYRIPSNHPSKDKLMPSFWAPCLLTNKLGNESYDLELLDIADFHKVKTFTAHSSALLPYHLRSDRKDEFDRRICLEEEGTESR